MSEKLLINLRMFMFFNVELRSIVQIFVLVLLTSAAVEMYAATTSADTLKSNSGRIVVHRESSVDTIHPRLSCTYSWLSGNDTLDLRVRATRWPDYGIRVSLLHNKPADLKVAIAKIQECMPMLAQDFDTSNWNSIAIRLPWFYPDIVNQLTKEYKKKFGRGWVADDRVYKFLMKSVLAKRLNAVLLVSNKKVKRFWMEKQHLVSKKYFSSDLPNTDLTNYPEFSINANQWIHVVLEDVNTTR